jgi:hypothetical protein
MTDSHEHVVIYEQYDVVMLIYGIRCLFDLLHVTHVAPMPAFAFSLLPLDFGVDTLLH